jgi:hypothetical protein
VTTPRGPQPPGRGAPSPGWSPLRALLVLAIAVALGAYLIDLGAGHHTPVSGASSSSTTGTTTTTTTTTSTTTTTTAGGGSTTTTTTAPAGVHPSATVKVLVANASQTNGVATYYSQKLATAGWGTLTPVTATTARSTSTIFYAAGQKRDALAVATALGLATSALQPLGGTVPVLSTAGADIVVVAGNDLASKVPAGSG